VQRTVGVGQSSRYRMAFKVFHRENQGAKMAIGAELKKFRQFRKPAF
jgi:hypothetical protein